ncbi:MAG: hypothetical protein AB1410_03745 [Acidobacteriota bacterium]
MSKRLLACTIFFVISVSLFSLTPKEIDKYLRNYFEKGYRFLRSEGNYTWYIAFKNPEWKTEWSVVVVLLTDESGNEVITIGTTIATFDQQPTPALMKYLLERNGDNTNIGSFSLYTEDKYYVQYFVRIPNNYCSLDQIIFSIGWVAGYCNTLQEDVVKYTEDIGEEKKEAQEKEFVGRWRVYSERLVYDEGGAGPWLTASKRNAVTRKLELKADGTWSFGSSQGKWRISPISASDWEKWKIPSYGPTRKIILEGWNKNTASGAVEEGDSGVNFIWVLYRVGPPTVSRPGTVHMKFGR